MELQGVKETALFRLARLVYTEYLGTINHQHTPELQGLLNDTSTYLQFKADLTDDTQKVVISYQLKLEDIENGY
jgi:hypothetical protein